MKLPVVFAKLRPPELGSDHFPRPDLLNQLQREQKIKKLSLLIAGVGYGKSTLLAELAEIRLGQNQPVLWYSLDLSDRDPEVFFTYLAAGLQSIWPQHGFSPDNLQIRPDQPNSQRLALALLSELESVPVEDRSLLIVLDDYHRLESSRTIDEAFSVLLERLPAGIHIAVTSRSPVSFPTGRLMALNQVHELNEDDLRFQNDEIERFFGVGFVSEGHLQKLVARSEGWIAGLLLLRQAVQLQEQPDLDRLVADKLGPFEQIYQYLADEILDRQTPELKKFLLHTSILKTFSPEDCNAIFNRSNSANLLDYLFRNRLFTYKLGGNPPVYRYHQLLSEYLEQKRRVEVDEINIDAWHQQASKYYLERQQWNEAFEHAVLSGKETLTVDIASQAFTEMRLTGRLDTFQSWLDTFTPDSFQSNPMLFILQGMLWSDRGLFAQARGAFRQALEVAGVSEQRSVIVKAWSGLGMVHQRTGDLASAEECFQKALEYTSPEQVQEWHAVINGLAHVYLFQGQNQRAQELFRQCIELAAQMNKLVQAVVMNNLGSVLLTQGEFTEALFWFENALKVRREMNSPPGMAICLNNMAMVQTRLGRLEAARSNLDQARSMLDESQYPMYAAYFLSNYGDVALEEGDWMTAEESYRRSIELKEAVNDPPGLVHTWSRFCELRRKQQNLDDALHYAQQAANLSLQSTGLNEQMLAQAELGIVQLCRGEYRLAADILASVANTQRGVTHNLYGCASSLWYLAAAWRALGNDFQEPLAESLNIISLQDYAFLVDHLGNDHPELLVEALVAGIQPALIQRVFLRLGARLAGKLTRLLKTEGVQIRLQTVDMLASIGSAPVWGPLMKVAEDDSDEKVRQKAQDAIEHLLNAPPPPLFVTTLGGFSLKRGEDVIPNSSWKNRKALELLKYLLTLEGKPVHRETLMELLWPEGRPDKAAHRLNQLLHRIRKMLEPYLPPRYSRYLVPEEDAYRLVLPEGSFVDDLELMAAATAGKRAYQAGDLYEAEACFQMVIDLYHGYYLPEDPFVEWTIPRRENLISQVVAAALLVAEMALQRNQAERAAETAGRALEIDPLQETGYELLMRAYLALGRPEAVLAAYQQYRIHFCAELDVQPSKALENLSLQARV